MAAGPTFDHFDSKTIQHNGVRQLIEYLRHPDDRWTLLARTAIGATVVDSLATGPRIEADAVGQAVTAVVGGGQIAGATGAITVCEHTSLTGLPIHVLVDTRPEFADALLPRTLTVVALDDTDAGVRSLDHKARWSDWLHWSNLLQFASVATAEHIVATRTEATTLDLGAVTLVTGSSGSDDTSATASPSATAEDLGLITDEQVAALVRRTIARGAPVPEIGYEVDDALPPLEAAWVDEQVAVVVGLEADDVAAIVARGWTARDVDDWTLGELLAALEVEN
jgi:hypothetical protein